MLDTHSASLDDSPLAPTFYCTRDRVHGAGDALGRSLAGFAFVVVLAATTNLLGPAGLIVSCGLGLFAIGAKFSTAARRRHLG